MMRPVWFGKWGQHSLFCVLIVGSLFCLVWGGIHWCQQWSHNTVKGHFWEETKSLENQLQRDRDQIELEKQRVASLDPGPPPAWYWGGKYNWKWSTQNEVFSDAKKVLKELESDKQRIEVLLQGNLWYQLKELFRAIWGWMIRPILELLLLLAIFSFLLRLCLRYLIMHGKLGAVRV